MTTVFTNWLIAKLLFGGTLFLAAAAPPLGGDIGIADGGDSGTGEGASNEGAGAGELDYGADEGAADDLAAGDGEQAGEGERREERQQSTEEPEVQEFKGSVSARLRNLAKQAPELSQVFQKYPKVQEQIEATFRREAALREVFPTVAEARQMREHFPNGLQDVQQLHSDVQEVEALDRDFYSRDQEGNFPGHQKIIDNMFSDDREAAVSLFRTLPKEWARLDRDSYNEVMGQIVGATISWVPDYLSEMIEDAKAAKQDGIVSGLTKLLNWTSKFNAEKPRPTPEAERLQRDRQAFSRQTQEREREEGQKFHRSFVSDSRKLQTGIIKAHPSVKKMLESKVIPEQKKNELIEQIRQNTEKLLGKSPSFMRKLNPAYKSRKLDESLNLQKAAWSQQWLLNRMVRSVFNKEVPQLVSSNREALKRRAGAQQGGRPAQSKSGGDKASPAAPKQIGGRWYRDGGKGAPFTTAEIIAGKHL
jgi:hypothetical protein